VKAKACLSSTSRRCMRQIVAATAQMVRRLLDLATGEDARLALFEAALPLTRKPDYPPRCRPSAPLSTKL